MTQMLGSSIMKKTMKFIGLIAMAALLFSCEKKNIDTPVENPQETETPSDLSQLDPSKYLVSFGATIEDPYTKATIDTENGTIAFEDGDEVLVVAGEKTGTYVYGSSAFSPKAETDAVPTGSGDICAYYPATAYTASSGDVTFKIPGGADNTTTLGDKNPMAATLVISEGTASATFTNFCSILQVSITGNRTLEKVSLNNASKAIAQDSEYSVTWSEGVPSIATEATDNKAIEISSSATLNPTTPTVFYFILPAGTNLTGVSVTAHTTTTDNGGMSTYTISRGDWTPEKNQIYQMSFYAGLFSGGTGTEEDPYIIANTRDFKHISTYSTSGYNTLQPAHFLGAHYRQINDLNFKEADITSYMIGSSENPFSGTYVGYKNGAEAKTKLISLKINGDGASVAIFRNVTGTIKHISVASAEVSGNEVVGALVGTLDGGTISNCIHSGNTVTGSSKVGGLVGEAKGTAVISNCETQTGDAVNPGNSTNYVGGIVGYITKAEVTNCLNKAHVSGAGYVGGIAGYFDDGLIDACRFAGGSVTGSGENVGGIAGYQAGGTLKRSVADKGITVTGLTSVGGLVGQMNAANKACLLIDCAAKSNVHSTHTTDGQGRSGGLVGTLQGSADFIAVVANSVGLAANIYNDTYNSAAGAIVGYMDGNKDNTIARNCYSQANASNFVGYSPAKDGSDIEACSQTGGVFGYCNYGSVLDCYYVNVGPGAGQKSETETNYNLTYLKSINNKVKNGTALITTSMKFAGGSTMKNAALGNIMRRGRWAGATSGVGAWNYTSSYSTETPSSWEGPTSEAASSYTVTYPSSLNSLGDNYIIY